MESAVSETTHIVGYARVSTEEQIVDVQMSALRAAGCEKIFEEKISAVNAKRPQFDLMMKFLEPGDTLIIHSLSRLGRDSGQIRDILKAFDALNVTWRSVTEPHLDMRNAVGRYMVNITSALAQFERDQVIERTRRGMDECRRKGMYLGAPIKVTPTIAKQMKKLRKTMTVADIARRFDVSSSAVYTHTR